MKIKIKGDWIEYVTEFGRPFYYNEKNGRFQWTDPTLGSASEGVTPTEGGSAGPWKLYKDPDTGGVFWFNHETNVSQWECPFASEPGGGRGGAGTEEGDEHAVVVNDFSDLGI